MPGLAEDTIDERKVAAKHDGGQSEPQSDRVRVKSNETAPGTLFRFHTLSYSYRHTVKLLNKRPRLIETRLLLETRRLLDHWP